MTALSDRRRTCSGGGGYGWGEGVCTAMGGGLGGWMVPGMRREGRIALSDSRLTSKGEGAREQWRGGGRRGLGGAWAGQGVGGGGLFPVALPRGWGGAAKGPPPISWSPTGGQPTACTLALWWLEFGPTGSLGGGGGGFFAGGRPKGLTATDTISDSHYSTSTPLSLRSCWSQVCAPLPLVPNPRPEQFEGTTPSAAQQ